MAKFCRRLTANDIAGLPFFRKPPVLKNARGPNRRQVLRSLSCAGQSEPILYVGSAACCSAAKAAQVFVVNATAIIPQTDEALRILLAVSFRVGNRLLNIDFRLRWCVNGTHLSLCVVAPFEGPRQAHELPGPSARNIRSPSGSLSTGCEDNEWSCLPLPTLRRVAPRYPQQKKGAAAVFSATASLSADARL